MSRPPTDLRDRVLDAAIRLLAEEGASRLTLAAVAARAQASKGGLLHQFADRDALLTAVLERLVERFEAAVEALRAPGPGGYVRAYVAAVFDDPDLDASRAFVAVVAERPALLGPLQTAWSTWLARAGKDGLLPDVATAAIAAADGVWLHRLVGVPTPDLNGLRARVLATLEPR